ncbi:MULTISPECIES: pseudouridine synthase [unclassified Acinetobacter]|uniref:pseudouridine synthase n=1 Tax=unclassified Acinetobacter TaxID=196816 RepID=UPI002934A783|nr:MULTISPECIES: pseudouridine synthase [unclassified Acinetobacter]WOE32044.1 pseudouridine synthase [Acinetobacter sp. SAAs470]WOE37513.1 pseudouridine synthase [Acinetobacter sp. SAAs474]
MQDSQSLKTKTDFIPPMIDGVSASQVYLPDIQPQPATVFAYLCHQFSHITPQEWSQRFIDQLIYDQSGNCLNIDSPFTAYRHVFYYRFLKHEIVVPFPHHILFENDHLLVVDKPHFLTMTPTGQYVQQTLLVRLKQQTNNPYLTPIHRLDRETAGVVLFSKTPETRGHYQQLFAQRQVYKSYHAIAPFNPTLTFPQQVNLRMEKGIPFYTMQVMPGINNSQTDITLLHHNQHWAKYLLQPHTGKQHQLRVHLSYLGLPIKNDPFYPQVIHKPADDFSAPLQLLAKHLTFQDPIQQREMCFSSQYDLDL